MITMDERFSEVRKTLNEDAPEREILTAARHENWDDLLELLQELPHSLETEVAAICLQAALENAPLNVFHKLLGDLPEKEYIGSYSMDYVPGEQRMEADGTLVLLAAVMGKTEQLRALLDRGWDVNSASLDASCQLMGRHWEEPHFSAVTQQFTSFAVRSESCLRHMRMSGMTVMPVVHQLHYAVTPLAAAMMCGQAACVRILLEHGAW